MDIAYADVDGVWLDGLDFCSRVYRLHERLMQRPNVTTRLRLRPTAFEKKLIEELQPLCRYIQTYYGPGRHLSVRWSSGNQSWDAEYLQRGAIIDHCNLPRSGYIEITTAMHANAHLQRERLESHGFAYGLDGLSRGGSKRKGKPIESVPVVMNDASTIAAMAALIIRSIDDKAGRYPDNASLIVECTLNTLYEEHHWQDLLASIADALPEHGFNGIFLCSASCGLIGAIGRP